MWVLFVFFPYPFEFKTEDDEKHNEWKIVRTFSTYHHAISLQVAKKICYTYVSYLYSYGCSKKAARYIYTTNRQTLQFYLLVNRYNKISRKIFRIYIKFYMSFIKGYTITQFHPYQSQFLTIERLHNVSLISWINSNDYST